MKDRGTGEEKLSVPRLRHRTLDGKAETNEDDLELKDGGFPCA